MKLSETVKPISYLKAHASEIIRDTSDNHRTYVITLNGEAKAVVQDVAVYERMQESLALLKMLAQSTKRLAQGEHKPVRKTFHDIRARFKGE